jgi:hypothetical protein
VFQQLDRNFTSTVEISKKSGGINSFNTSAESAMEVLKFPYTTSTGVLIGTRL